MMRRESEEPLSEERRKEIFQALVDAQDREMTVPQSYQFIQETYLVSEKQLRQIEREGLERQWPPL
jgi:hypothetical protein